MGSVPTAKPLVPLIDGPNWPLPRPGVNQDIVAAAVGDDQVGDAVAVQVSQLDGAGASRPLDWLAMTWVRSELWLVVPYSTVTLLSDWSAKTKSGTPLPVRSATARAMAALTGSKGRNEPSPLPTKMSTSPSASPTRRSRRPSPVTSATVKPMGSVPAL